VEPFPEPFAHAEAQLQLPLAVEFGASVDVVEVLSTLGFVQGQQPHSCSTKVEGTLALDALSSLPWCRVLRAEERLGGRASWAACVEGDGWRALVRSNGSDIVQVRVSSADGDGARRAVRRLAELVQPVEEPPGEEQVAMSFHYLGERGVSSERRLIDAPDWDEIGQNYPDAARESLTTLFAMGSPPAVGRLVLLHGPPGTGKTTAIRSLVRAWKGWCDASYVMDPEVLFSRTSYLNQLVLSGDDDAWIDDEDTEGPTGPQRWRLLVVEDADEIIAADARDRSGQSLSRLLNLTDGLLGQGLHTLVLITTNEPVTSLHPALTRPGRCLAEIEIPRFDVAGARRWLGDRGGKVPHGGATLAELFALRDGEAVRETPAPTGLYL
jgi:hypothetical protein